MLSGSLACECLNVRSVATSNPVLRQLRYPGGCLGNPGRKGPCRGLLKFELLVLTTLEDKLIVGSEAGPPSHRIFVRKL